MDIKKILKSIAKAFLVSIAYMIVATLAVALVIALKKGEVSDKVLDVCAYVIGVSYAIIFVGSTIYFYKNSNKVVLKESKMNDYKDYVIVDELRDGASVLAIYFYKFKDGKFDDSFFFSFYNRYRFENAEMFLSKIRNFCGDLVLISDRCSNYKYLDKLFTINGVEVLKNERVAIDEYVAISNIRKDFVNSKFEFCSMDDVFIKCAREVNAQATKQLFEGKLLYILSYYNNLKEVQ